MPELGIACLLSAVADVQAKRQRNMTTFHPRADDNGKHRQILKPSQPTDLGTWSDPSAIARAVPDSTMPDLIGDVSVAAWNDAPATSEDWELLVKGLTFSEPPMPSALGKKPAAGVVTIEPDGRVWAVAPTDGYGGYATTFPKGKLDGLSPRATAIKEAFEESGLRVELTGYLCDIVRTTSVTRYYTARRVGGNPAAMGWESQAVMLVPINELRSVTTHPNDAPIISALPHRAIIAYEWGLASGHRVLDTLAGYFARYGEWPTEISIEIDMHDGLRDTIFTPYGWRLLNERLKVHATDTPRLEAEGGHGQKHSYDTNGPVDLRKRASEWIWNVDLT